MATQKIRLRIQSYDSSLIEQVVARVVDNATKLGCKISGPIPLPTKKEVVTILRAPHKDKDSREQFESRTHIRLIDVYAPNEKAAQNLLKMAVPEGVSIDVKL